MTVGKVIYASVAFKKHGGAYQGSVPLSDLALLPNDPADTMRAVTGIYEAALLDIKRWQREAKSLRQSRTPMSVRKAWELGDVLHRLNTNLAGHGCQLENLYDHLEHHAGLPPKRATSFVTLRRYVDDADVIPQQLQWNRIMKTVKATSQAIAAGLPVEN